MSKKNLAKEGTSELTWAIGITCIKLWVLITIFDFALGDALFFWGGIVVFSGVIQEVFDDE